MEDELRSGFIRSDPDLFRSRSMPALERSPYHVRGRSSQSPDPHVLPLSAAGNPTQARGQPKPSCDRSQAQVRGATGSRLPSARAVARASPEQQGEQVATQNRRHGPFHDSGRSHSFSSDTHSAVLVGGTQQRAATADPRPAGRSSDELTRRRRSFTPGPDAEGRRPHSARQRHLGRQQDDGRVDSARQRQSRPSEASTSRTTEISDVGTGFESLSTALSPVSQPPVTPQIPPLPVELRAHRQQHGPGVGGSFWAGLEFPPGREM